jgi:predicted nucleic-acid-binding Zn-ribbon protein
MKYVKICPQCGSTNVKMPKAGLDLRMTVRDMCMQCGNIGNFPEVEIDKVEYFRKKLRK